MAHWALPLFLAVGCGSSHGRSDATDGGTGSDAARPRDGGTVRDAGRPADATTIHPPAHCDAEDARAELCPDAVCDGPGSYHWNGERCVFIDCGACRGDDCGGPITLAECEAAHASCEPALCRATGGTWSWWAEECGHYVCGSPPPADCEVGFQVCDCGIGRSFAPGTGCFDDPSCGAIDPLPADVLCASTGGTWGSFCCPSVCGQLCEADCAAPACNCGVEEIFDPVRGCVVGEECMNRTAGQTCEGRARCEDGTICCMHCGGAGCTGPATCEYPTCDADPDRDECGNSLLAP